MNIQTRLIIVLALGMLSQAASAHSEHDKARFVAANGVDTGNCKNRARPCKSIEYAASRANKGDKILVAGGKYVLQSDNELFYLLSESQPVLAGFNRVDLYNSQNPNKFPSFISAVPAQHAEALAKKGFTVIRDSKEVNSKQFQNVQSLLSSQKNQQPAQQCENGKAGIYSCDSISLLGHVPLGSFPSNPNGGNDIWGHYDLNTQREYALMGLRNAFAVVDVTDPENPVIVGSVSGEQTTWRDIKVYQHYDEANKFWRAYAYVTADNAADGLRIFDLSNLPTSFELVKQDNTDRNAHNVYVSNVDYSLNISNSDKPALVHVAGANNAGGAFRTFSLDDPANPNLDLPRTNTNRTDYSHDLASLNITDQDAQNTCGEDECMVMIDFNENEMRIWEHNKADEINLLSSSPYPNAAYTHSGWWSEDKRYVFLHDELDEQNFGINTTIHIFDVSDMRAPVRVGEWVGPTKAIDHNGFVRGNRYYMSNYTRGLTVLDISDPKNPSQAGFFDTFTISDATSFDGAWGVYPFLPSGNLLVSDISSGLFVLADKTTADAAQKVFFANANVSVDEGNSVTIDVQKSGDAATEVAYETLRGSADHSDFTAKRGVISWQQGDSTSKQITIDALNDSLDGEVNEHFFVRLFDPKSGVTLSAPNLVSVNINGLANSGVVAFTQEQIEARENQTSVDIVVKRSGASQGIASVNYELQSGTAIVGEDAPVTSGTLTWQDGDNANQVIQLTLTNDDVEEVAETLKLVLSAENSGQLGATKEITITILDDESNQAPSANAGGNRQVNARQTVRLDGTGSDPEGGDISFLWEQTSGATVTLSNANTRSATFTAPNSQTTLGFQLKTTDAFGASSTDSITVSVVASATPPPTQSTESSGGGAINWLMLVALAMLVRVRRS